MSESSPVFADGLGRRVVRLESAEAAPAEHLLLSPDLASHAGFTAALAERVAKLHGRRLTAYARVQRVDGDGPAGVSVVSEFVKGWRLADLLDVAESENLTLDIGVVMLLLRQLLPTAALLSTQIRDAASGALGPEHLLLTPQGRLVMTDYVFGGAIEALGWDAEQLWTRLRVATPPGKPGKAVSQRGDVVQVGVTVLSLVAGRRLRDDEFPERLEDLVSSARQKTPAIIDAPLSPGLRDWLMRALQLAPKSFEKLFDAQMALERLLAADGALLAQPAELDQAVARFERFMPVVELPEPPAELPLLEAPPPDLVPLAVAFDRPAVKAEPVAAAPEPAPVEEPAPTPEPVTAEVVPAPTRKSGVRRKKGEAAAVVESMPAPPIAVVDDLPEPAEAPPEAVVASEDAPPPAGVADELAAPAVQAAPPAPPSVVPFPQAARGWEEPAAVSAAMEPPEPVVIEAEAPWWRSARVVAALVALAVAQTAFIGWSLSRPSESLGSDGELVVQSRPEGATVVIDDREQGVTPLTVRVSPGTHVLQVRAGAAEPRVIPLQIRAGVQTAQYVELQGVATTGVLEVRSEPAKARVTIDGRERGSTPLTLRDVAPGDYKVVLERAGWKSTQVVRVEPGGTAQLVVPIR
ncbi:MAG: PEGA domain-containing protein [Acidobacteria bacterium]|nr:PEGA domain-containing protein [Acidobacteriota bacterium]